MTSKITKRPFVVMRFLGARAMRPLLYLMFYGLAQSAAYAGTAALPTPIPRKTAAIPVTVKFKGSVKWNESYRKPIGHGLIFKLMFSDDESLSGWIITVGPEGKRERDYVWVATPPYHFDNPRYLAIGYRTAREAVEWTPRRFFFVMDEVEYQKAQTALRRVDGSIPKDADCGKPEIESAQEYLLGSSVRNGEGSLSILRSEITGSGNDARIQRIDFKVEIHFPTLKQEALPGNRIRFGRGAV